MADELGRRLEILSKEIRSQAIMNRVSTLIMQIIEERSLKGGYLNSDAPGYSERYKKKRQQRGLQTDHVDLQFTGATWGSFASAVDVQKSEIALGFNRDELAKIASYHDVHGAGINKIRHEFLGLNDSELGIVNEFMIQEMGTAIDFLLVKDLPPLT